MAANKQDQMLPGHRRYKGWGGMGSTVMRTSHKSELDRPDDRSTSALQSLLVKFMTFHEGIAERSGLNENAVRLSDTVAS